MRGRMILIYNILRVKVQIHEKSRTPPKTHDYSNYRKLLPLTGAKHYWFVITKLRQRYVIDVLRNAHIWYVVMS